MTAVVDFAPTLTQVPLGIMPGDPDTVTLDASPIYTPRLKKLPGVHYSLPNGCWTIARTFPNMLMLGEWAREARVKLVPSPELRDWLRVEKPAWEELTKLAETVMAPAPREGLYAHQEQDVAWLTFPGGPPGRLLLSEPGVGKTRAVIVAMKEAKLFPAIVVSPVAVIDTGWVPEFGRVAPEIRVAVCHGGDNITKRRKAIAAIAAGEADVLVIGYEAMRAHTKFKAWHGVALKRCEACGGAKMSADGAVSDDKCQRHPKELNAIPWKLVVSDESHRVLSVESQTRQALCGLDAAVRWGMTATAVMKRKKVDRLWSLLGWVYPEAYPVKSLWSDRFCVEGYNDSGYREIQGWNPIRLPELQRSLSALSRRVLIDQALDLPPTLRGGSLIRELTMGAEQRRVYDEMRDEMIAWVEEGKITAANFANLTLRLVMLAGAVGYPGEQNGEMLLKAPSCKIDEIAKIIEFDDIGDQWVAAFAHKKLLRLAVQELCNRRRTDDGMSLVYPEQIGIVDGYAPQADRDAAINAFQAGRIPYLFFTHAAGGVGITLTAAEALVMVERPWADWQEKQSLGRVRRAGMKPRSVSVIDLVTRGTVEYGQMERLLDDAAVMEELLQDKSRLKAFLQGKHN